MRRKSLLGKYVLVGLTYLDEHDNPIRREQLHGRIVEANRGGIKLQLSGSAGEEFLLPPDADAFEPANPEDEYSLRETGEVIPSPDLVATWTIGPEYDAKGSV